MNGTTQEDSDHRVRMTPHRDRAAGLLHTAGLGVYDTAIDTTDSPEDTLLIGIQRRIHGEVDAVCDVRAEIGVPEFVCGPREVVWYVLEAYSHTPATRWQPEDVDVSEVSRHRRVEDALIAACLLLVRDRLERYLESREEPPEEIAPWRAT